MNSPNHSNGRQGDVPEGYTRMEVLNSRGEKVMADVELLKRKMDGIQQEMESRFKRARRDYNLTRSQLEELATRHDMHREERALIVDTAATSSNETRQPNFDYEGRSGEMLATYGQLGYQHKHIMLGSWMSTAARNGRPKSLLVEKGQNFLYDHVIEYVDRYSDSEEDAKKLLQNAGLLLNAPTEDVANLDVTGLFHWMIRSIPNEAWLQFARLELGMGENKIREIKKRGKPTNEMLVQLNRELEEWLESHRT